MPPWRATMAGKTELVPDANLQVAAVDKDDAAMACDDLVDGVQPRLPEMKAVHGRKEAGAFDAQLGERPLGSGGRFIRCRVQHEVGDDPFGVGPGCRRNRVLVARDAGDQHDTADPVSVHLGHPAVCEVDRIGLGKLPGEAFSQRRVDVRLRGGFGELFGQGGEEPVGEEMGVRVDHRDLAERGLHHLPPDDGGAPRRRLDYIGHPCPLQRSPTRPKRTR